MDSNNGSSPFGKVKKTKVLRDAWVVILFALLWGYLSYQAVGVVRTPFYKPPWRAQWIKYPKPNMPRSYFRKEFYLPDRAANAWIRLSADNDYILYLNDQSIGMEINLSSNSYPFQEHQTEVGQRIGQEVSFPIRNPPEVQWRSSKDWMVTTFYDITDKLQKGKNVLAVAVQSDQESARLLLEGLIDDVSGKRVHVLSDGSWKVSILEETDHGVPWYKRSFQASHWPSARQLAKPHEGIKVNFDPGMFRYPLSGEWIANPRDSGYDNYFRKRFIIDSKIDDAWLRITAKGNYDLFVNGTWIGSTSSDRNIDMFSIAPLLNRGVNVIAVHTRSPRSSLPPFRASITPSMLLLDVLIRKEDESVIVMTTNSSWETTHSVERGWIDGDTGKTRWTSSLPIEKAHPISLASLVRKYHGTSTSGTLYYKGLLRYWFLSVVGFLSLWLIYSRYLAKRLRITLSDSARVSLLCYWNSIILMLCLLLLRFSFGESPNKIFFHTPLVWQIATLGSVLILLLFKIYLIRSSVATPSSPRREKGRKVGKC